MPKASAPKAPCVAVWLSPQTSVMPGCVSPSSGPMMCTIPCSWLAMLWQGMPNSRQFASSCATCRAAIGSRMGSERSVVGTLGSAVAKVCPGRRTTRPRARRPSNACGDVTSCTRCMSIYSSAGAPGCSLTTCAPQTLSTMVDGIRFNREGLQSFYYRVSSLTGGGWLPGRPQIGGDVAAIEHRLDGRIHRACFPDRVPCLLALCDSRRHQVANLGCQIPHPAGCERFHLVGRDKHDRFFDRGRCFLFAERCQHHLHRTDGSQRIADTLP